MTVKSVLSVVFHEGDPAYQKVADLSPDGMTLHVSWEAFFDAGAATRRKLIEDALHAHRTEALRRDLIQAQTRAAIEALHGS